MKKKKFSVVSCQLSVGLFALLVILSAAKDLLCQQAQAQSGQPIYAVNAKYVQGVAPGYWPTGAAGLTLNVASGTSFCGTPPVAVNYAGGTLTLTASATNYVYLDPAAACAPASNTTGFSAGAIPLAKVVTTTGAISTVTDLRSWFVPQPVATDATGKAVTKHLNNIRFADQFAGADMGAKINAAIADCPAATGCWIMVPQGSFSYSQTILFDRQIKLIGAGKAATTLTYTGTGNALKINNNLFDVEGLTLDGSTGPASATVLLQDDGVKSVANGVFRDVTIVGGNIGLHLNSTALGIFWNSFENLQITDAGTNALKMSSVLPGFVNVNTFSPNCLLRTTSPSGTYALLTAPSGQVAANTFSCDASFANGVGGIGFDLVNSTNNVWIGGDYEADTTAFRFDAGSVNNRMFGVLLDASPIVDNTPRGIGNVGAYMAENNRFRSITMQAQYPNPGDMIRWLDAGNVEVDQYIEAGFVKLVNGANSWSFNGGTGSTSVTGSHTVGKALIEHLVTITFSPTPTFDASLGNTQKITLTANVTSSTLSNATAGEQINFIICQDATGGRTFAWPANVQSPPAINSAPGACTYHNTTFDGSNALPFDRDSSGALLAGNIKAFGTNQNITLTPSGTGIVLANNLYAEEIRNGDAVLTGINDSTTGNGAYIGTAATDSTHYALIVQTDTNISPTTALWVTADNKVGIGKTPGANAQLDVAKSAAFGLNTVTFSATPTFDASLGNTQKMTLTGNVTSSTLSDATAGEHIDFIICQDATGSRTFVWPTNLKGGMTIGATASKCSAQSFIFDGTNAYALSPGVGSL